MGAVNIDNTGSGASVTLSSNGTQLLLNGSAVGGGASAYTISNKTGAYTVVSGDLGAIINCTSGSFTVSLTAAASLGAGFNCWIWNTSTTSTDAITIDPNGAETIDGVSTIILRRGEGCQIVCNGTNWDTGDKKTMRGYADNLGPTNIRPVASGDRAVSIGSSSSATELFSQAFGNFSSATAVGASALGYSASASGSYSLGINGDCTGSYATSIGANSSGQRSQAITGSGAMALGGSYASGTNSFAAAVANNTSTYGATGANAVAIGYRAVASGTGSVNLGYNGTCSGSYSRNFGFESTATGEYSTIINGSGANDNGIWGKCVIGAAFVGGGQRTFVQLRATTTGNTATVLAANGVAAGAANQVILPNNSAFAFTGTVVARRQASGGTESAAWKIEGLIRREGTAGSTTLVASTVTAISNVPGWTLALSADTTNGGLAVTATGAAATNIKWLAVVESSEITYA